MNRSLTFTIAFLFFFIPATIYSQDFKKISIGNSGCSLYSYCDMKFEMSKSVDSSSVFAGECVKEGISYGVICVKLLHPPENLSMAEDLLIAYLDYLRENFYIISTAGYGKGQLLNNDVNTRGIVDYWNDQEKNKWKVKGWTNGKFIAVLYVYSKKSMTEPKMNSFLDGLRLAR